ncbi:MAG: hypothetical protein H0X33_10760 [Taibaiella sp.]|nr:hypothetical protein [Taibaiella sp.]
MIFDLTLAEEKVKPHQVTALHLLVAFIFLGTGALFWLYPVLKVWGESLLVIGAVLLLIVFLKNKWLLSGKVNTTFRIGELIIIATLIFFAAWKHWRVPTAMFSVLGAALLFALAWERSSTHLQIHVAKEGIQLPITARKRTIDWWEVEKVILKFGTLTIDCVDKRLYQWNVQMTAFDQKQFDAFCDARIEENITKRRQEW